jgi:glycosyltransferase involved in cell wall biosynthesis
MKLSLCIPTYEYNGNSKFLLTRLLNSIKLQTTTDFEIVISDQSTNSDVCDVCQEFDLNIKYVKCDLGGKSSYNINNAIKHASGEYIKPIWMDDFILNKNTIATLVDNLDSCYWGAVDFIHIDDNKQMFNYMMPNYTTDILSGNNRIGGPSVCFFKNDGNFFDEELIWFMDCDFYFRLNKKHQPLFLSVDSTPSMCISTENQFGSITNTMISQELINKEAEYLRKKYI